MGRGWGGAVGNPPAQGQHFLVSGLAEGWGESEWVSLYLENNGTEVRGIILCCMIVDTLR